MNEDVKNVFTPAPMISFRSARKLSSYLVRAKLYPLERIVGWVRCKGKLCQTCYNVKETETFTSTTTGKAFKINHELNCNDKCLVYLLTCNFCWKQCVGQTVEEFRYRWKNYKNNGRKYQEDGNIFVRRDTIAFWKMSILHWLTKRTHQTLYREKIIGEILWRQ